MTMICIQRTLPDGSVIHPWRWVDTHETDTGHIILGGWERTEDWSPRDGVEGEDEDDAY